MALCGLELIPFMALGVGPTLFVFPMDDTALFLDLIVAIPFLLPQLSLSTFPF
jgi:hypothetical protein